MPPFALGELCKAEPFVKRTRIKICGITSPDDAIQASELGADALGLVFYPPSPRAVSLQQAEAIVCSVPPLVSIVALFVDARRRQIIETLAQLSVDILQFHGQESADFCASFDRPWLKSVAMRPGTDLQQQANRYHGARGLLLDAWQQGVPGGTGKKFDWTSAGETDGPPIVLAGGLNSDNVTEAMALVKPAAVDVSSGVERSPGCKDKGKMAAFVRAVRDADAGNS